MNEILIKDFDDLEDLIENYICYWIWAVWWFIRGLSKTQWNIWTRRFHR